jgi:hypothetical protein
MLSQKNNLGGGNMIKILIVLEEEDGIDFRAYSLQISNRSKDLPPQAKLQPFETNAEPDAVNDLLKPSSDTELKCNFRIPVRQLPRTLETQQIFMN